MKHKNTCTKCESHDIFKIPGPATVGYSQNKVPKSFFSSANVDRYVCARCGYSEEWIAYEKDLAQLAQKYGKPFTEGNEFV